MKSNALALAFLGLLAVQTAARSQVVHSFAIRLQDSSRPLMTDADLIEYRFAEHALKVRAGVLARIPKLSLTGTAFDVVVDGERIYSGLLVPDISSMSYKVPTIWAHAEHSKATADVLVIHRPLYPESRWQPGPDPRFDPRIHEALAALGKLVEGDVTAADYEPALAQSIERILKECATLVPGTTRAELGQLFTGEGGLSTAKHATFVHRRCPYIKVDVDFNLAEPRQNLLEQRLTDTVAKVSKPYLAWSVAD